MLMYKFMKMDGAGDGTGGGGSGSLLTPSGGGGAAAGGGTGTPPATPPTGGNATPPAAGAGGTPPGNASADWRAALPKELQDSPSLKKFTSVEALAGAYTSAEKMIGMDKIVVPNQTSTEADWQNVFKKLGLPEDVTKYDVKFKEGNTLDPKFVDAFKKLGHSAGILPSQAQKLADWFTETNMNAEKEQQALIDGRVKQEHADLQKEWGQAYQLNLSRAQQVIEKFADKDVVDYLAKSGLGNDVRLAKLLSKVGNEMFKEGKIVGDASSPGAMTPQAARAEIDKIQGVADHPYKIKGHPEHASAVAKMADLFQMAYGKVDDE